MAKLLVAYDSGRDHVEPIAVQDDSFVFGRREADANGGIGDFRVVEVSGMTVAEVASIVSPEVEEVVLDKDLKPDRRRLEAKWWTLPVDNLPNRLRSGFRSGSPQGRMLSLTRGEFLAWATENPKVSEHLLASKTLAPPRIEPPPDKTRTQV